jgi:hypothetical protein
MKNNKLTIQIHRPVSEVFAFTLNPQNTPRWIDGITEEIANEYPTRRGTKYKNQDMKGRWTEYTVSEFIFEKMFVFSKNDTTYHVRYTFTQLEDAVTTLEYYEWVDTGDLEEAFTQDNLIKLKNILEEK